VRPRPASWPRLPRSRTGRLRVLPRRWAPRIQHAPTWLAHVITRPRWSGRSRRGKPPVRWGRYWIFFSLHLTIRLLGRPAVSAHKLPGALDRVPDVEQLADQRLYPGPASSAGRWRTRAQLAAPHEIAGMLIWVFCAHARRTRGSSTFTNNRRGVVRPQLLSGIRSLSVTQILFFACQRPAREVLPSLRLGAGQSAVSSPVGPAQVPSSRALRTRRSGCRYHCPALSHRERGSRTSCVRRSWTVRRRQAGTSRPRPVGRSAAPRPSDVRAAAAWARSVPQETGLG
jgi:hypothetical protein